MTPCLQTFRLVQWVRSVGAGPELSISKGTEADLTTNTISQVISEIEALRASKAVTA